MDSSEYIGIAEAAARLGVSNGTIRQLVAEGHLTRAEDDPDPALGASRYRVVAASVEGALERQAAATAAADKRSASAAKAAATRRANAEAKRQAVRDEAASRVEELKRAEADDKAAGRITYAAGLTAEDRRELVSRGAEQSHIYPQSLAFPTQGEAGRWWAEVQARREEARKAAAEANRPTRVGSAPCYDEGLRAALRAMGGTWSGSAWSVPACHAAEARRLIAEVTARQRQQRQQAPAAPASPRLYGLRGWGVGQVVRHGDAWLTVTRTGTRRVNDDDSSLGYCAPGHEGETLYWADTRPATPAEVATAETEAAAATEQAARQAEVDAARRLLPALLHRLWQQTEGAGEVPVTDAVTVTLPDGHMGGWSFDWALRVSPAAAWVGHNVAMSLDESRWVWRATPRTTALDLELVEALAAHGLTWDPDATPPPPPPPPAPRPTRELLPAPADGFRVGGWVVDATCEQAVSDRQVTGWMDLPAMQCGYCWPGHDLLEPLARIIATGDDAANRMRASRLLSRIRATMRPAEPGRYCPLAVAIKPVARESVRLADGRLAQVTRFHLVWPDGAEEAVDLEWPWPLVGTNAAVPVVRLVDGVGGPLPPDAGALVDCMMAVDYHAGLEQHGAVLARLEQAQRAEALPAPGAVDCEWRGWRVTWSDGTQATVTLVCDEMDEGPVLRVTP